MIESIILGLIQGITEWLPVSSSGIILLVQTNWFNSTSLADNIQFILFLHLGTFFSALLYFRKDITKIIRTLFTYKNADTASKTLLSFLILSTIVSGVIGLILFSWIEKLDSSAIFTGKMINAVMGVFFLVTATFQFRARRQNGSRNITDLNPSDGILLGVMQGISALPGISRSGITVAGLLLRRIKKVEALRLSFLMSMPFVMGANIILNFKDFALKIENFLGLLVSFLVGVLTIHMLLKMAERLNLGYFSLIFGLLLIGAALI